MKIIFNFIIGLAIIVGCAYGIYKLLNRNSRKDKNRQSYQPPTVLPTPDTKAQKISNQWDNCYEPQYLLSQNEKYQFRKLMNWAKDRGMYIFTKVRLADLIKPRGNNQKLFWKIQAKHVDFVICDGNLKVKLIIELQDNTHSQPDRKERDEFMKQVLENCGYKTLWVYNINDDVLNKALGIIEQPAKQEPEITAKNS